MTQTDPTHPVLPELADEGEGQRDVEGGGLEGRGGSLAGLEVRHEVDPAHGELPLVAVYEVAAEDGAQQRLEFRIHACNRQGSGMCSQ